MAERWTAAQVNSLAPDAASQKAGAKLGVPGPWSGTGYLDSERLLWGDCKGSGSKPYQVTRLRGGLGHGVPMHLSQ